jgi:hypothetical protein
MKIFTAILIVFLLTMFSCQKETILPTSQENQWEMENRSSDRNGDREEPESDVVTDPDDDSKSERENSKKKKKS